VTFLCLGRDVGHAPVAILLRFPLDKAPEELAEAVRSIHLQHGTGVGDRGLDLAAMADDAGICEQACDLLRSVTGDGAGIEIIERGTEVLALAQDRDPGEPWKPSSTSFSNSARASASGSPHSVS
jgi:hypothetical protein